MKIEQISENKVRVSITNAEMTEMNIRPEMFAAGGKELNTFLFNIMDEISKQTDFDPYFGSLTMEAIHDTDGMSIMISKGIDTSRLGDQTGSKSVGDEIDELKTLAGILSKLSAIADVKDKAEIRFQVFLQFLEKNLRDSRGTVLQKSAEKLNL